MTAAAQVISAPVVQTAKGAVIGTQEKGTFSYKGIPYAADTGGANRFLPPAERQAWAGIYNATDYGPACPQHSFGFIGNRATSEDCLRLNVWTPAFGGRRPVMVWFHGGAFKLGSDNYVAEGADGASAAIQHDYVFVSLTHRLNVAGYFQLGPEFGDKYAKSGNVGMLDLAAALRWVKQNIAQFGGDPSNVTIAGPSGGGAKTTHALAMPAFKGLFDHAIVFVGHDLWKRNSHDAPLRSSRAVLNALGVAPGDIATLQNMPMEQMLNACDAVSASFRRIRRGERRVGSSTTSCLRTSTELRFQPIRSTQWRRARAPISRWRSASMNGLTGLRDRSAIKGRRRDSI